MMDPLYRFLPWDHVSLGQRLRQAREATMGLLLVARLTARSAALRGKPSPRWTASAPKWIAICK